MKELEQIEIDYNSKLTLLKYDKAVSLLKLLSDEDYAEICELNPELINPILEEKGEEYLHCQAVLDKLVELFTESLQKKAPNPEELDSEELFAYIESLLKPLDQERLCGIAKVIMNMLGVN